MNRKIKNFGFAMLTLIGWLALGSSVSAGGELVPETIEPLHVLTFAESTEVSSVVIHPDDERAFVLVVADSVNLWAVLVWYWPEVLGVLSGLVGLVLLWFIWRVRRRVRIVGEPYCRKCDYCLTGAVAGSNGEFRCAECGYDLSRRRVRVARRMWVRLALPVTMLVLVVLGYGSLWVGQVPRNGVVGTWFFWRSEGLLEFSKTSRGGWLKQFVMNGDLLLEIDLESGETLRHIYAHSGRTYFQMSMAPDGGSVFIENPSGSGVIQISTDNGRILSQYNFPTALANFGLDRPAVIDFHEEEPIAYVAFANGSDGKTYVVEWNLETSGWRILTTLPSFVKAGVPRNFRYDRGSDGQRFISFPGLHELMDTGEFKIGFHDVKTGETEMLEMGAGFDSFEVPALTSDNGRAFVRKWSSGEIIEVDLKERRILGDGSTSYPGSQHGRMEVIMGDRYLVVPSFAEAFYLLDITKRQQVARLTGPAKVYAIAPYPSMSGRWLAGIGQRNLGPGSYADDLVIWDLRDFMDGREAAAVRERGESGE